MRRAATIELTTEERAELGRIAFGRRREVRHAERAKMILLAADGVANLEIGLRLGVSRVTVGVSRDRFAAERLAGIAKDRPRAGRAPTLLQRETPRILEATLRDKPPAATHWSTRTLAAHLGVDKMLVARVWKINGLKPHLIETFKVSNDPRFAREDDRHRRPVRRSARTRVGTQRRREESNTSARFARSGACRCFPAARER